MLTYIYIDSIFGRVAKMDEMSKCTCMFVYMYDKCIIYIYICVYLILYTRIIYFFACISYIKTDHTFHCCW